MLKMPDFKQAEVRDLAWVMWSPGLMRAPAGDGRLVSDAWCQQVCIDHLESLQRLDQYPGPLLDYLSGRKNHRLGFYFEMLLAFWHEHILLSKPFLKNVAVFQELKYSGRRTLGEFDFLFGQKNQSVLQHWEATVKFYLRHENEFSDVRWLGPAGQDRLDIKLARIFEHQLTLADTAEGRAVINQSLFSTVDASAFIKGYLFYPVIGEEISVTKDAAKANDPALYSPFKVSPEHLRGWWLRHTESVPPKQFVSSRWLILPKVRWLSAAWYPNEHSGMLFDDLGVSKYCTQHFGENSSALLLAEMQPGSNGWFEVSRGFVVSPGWPMLE